MPEFADWDDYETWLREQPRGVVLAMTVRLALRVLPGAFARSTGAAGPLSFSVLRGVMTSGVVAMNSNAETREAAGNACTYILHASDPSPGGPHFFAFTAAHAAASFAANIKAHEIVSVRWRAQPSLGFPIDASLSAVSHDSSLADDIEPLMERPLWTEDISSDEIVTDLLHHAADANPVWSFWARWYEGFLTGAPLDWDLQTQIALIPDSEWQKAEGEAWQQVAERIAKGIADIEREFYQMALEEARKQVERLKRSPRLNATIAKGLSKRIQMALDEYRRTISNALPEALEPLDRLPGLLDTTAAALIESKPDDEIAELVVAMATTIGELNRRLTKVHQDLASRPKEPTASSLVRQGAYVAVGAGIVATAGAAAATVGAALFASDTWGYLMSALGDLIGPSQAHQIEGLGNCYDCLIGPDAICPPEIWAAPDYSET